MSTAMRRAPATATAPTANSRLRLYARYATLVNEQERALDEGDLEAFQGLADSRDEVQEQVERMEDPDAPESTDDSPALRDEAAEFLRSALAADGRVRSKLADLRQHTLEGIRQMDNREEGARRYIEEAAKRPDTASRVDVRL